MVKVLPGEFYVRRNRRTRCSSLCSAPALRPASAIRVTGIGGMNHFMLPQGGTRRLGRRAGIGALRQFRDGEARQRADQDGMRARRWRSRYSAAATLPTSSTAIGTSNARFVLRYLDRPKGLPAWRRISGGQLPRRIQYRPTTGKRGAPAAWRRRVEGRRAGRKSNTPRGLSTHRTSGEIEIFGLNRSGHGYTCTGSHRRRFGR